MEGLAEMWDAKAALATAPMLTLTVGIVLLLMIEILPSLVKARPFIFVGTIVGAAWSLIAISRDDPGYVLDETFLADQTFANWGLIFLFSTLLAWTFAQRYYRTAREGRAFIGEHDILMLTTPIGMMLMAGAQDFIVFFVGLELLSIPLYCLASFRRARNDSVEAGLKYFVLGAFAAATFLFGAALIYVDTGTVSIADLRLAGPQTTLGIAGVALVAASLFFKVSVFPFHLWVPDVYQGSPTPVTVLMATGTKAAGFAVLLNIAFLIPESAQMIVGIIAVITMAVGNLGALVQDDLKRMLAYSGVAHAGTMLLLVAAQSVSPTDAMSAGLYYMAAYVFTAGGAFGLISWLESDGEHFTKISSLRGLARRRPRVAAALALFMLSLGGIPATGGFLGKWFVFSIAVRADMIGLAIIGILFSVVALGYYLRVVVAIYMEAEPEGQAPPMTPRLSAAIATGICVAMVLLLGLLPGLFIG
jgi:NADH-quinone oxidoreductase subunit N